MSDKLLSTIVWAVAVVVIVVIVVLIFRKDIVAFLARIRKLGLLGGSLDLADLPAPLPEKQLEAQQQATVEAPSPRPPEPHPIYTPAEADVRRQLDAIPGATVDMKLAWALRMFAMAAIDRGHEMNYRLIFTSQIWAIDALNQRGPVPLERGRELFDQAAAANEDFRKHVTWESWVKFLVNTGYVHVDTSNPAQPIASITDLGKHFLHWMVEKGLSPIRPL